MENIQVPLPRTVPLPSYLLILEALPMYLQYLPSQSSRGIEQGQGRGACTVRILWKNRGGDIHRYLTWKLYVSAVAKWIKKS